MLVGSGAAIGTLSRYGLSHTIGVEPLATTSINVLGCALFGIIAIAAKQQPRLVLFLGTGFCGGFTTFSTFSLLSVTTARADDVWLAVGIVLLHLIFCPLAYFLGSRRSVAWTERQKHLESKVISEVQQ